jgi:hypothetical protein
MCYNRQLPWSQIGKGNEEFFQTLTVTFVILMFRPIRYFIRLTEILPFFVLYNEPLKNAIFYDVASCEYDYNRRFGGTYHLHRHGGEESAI